MIFKSFFRPKYNSSDPKVRLAAIELLSTEDQTGKSQLHELAFNDENSSVSIAALSKLNSFPLWCKMAQTGKNERVKKRAQAYVEDTLFDDAQERLSAQEKRTFIVECKDKKLLEKWLKQAVEKGDELNLIQQVLQKLDKPQLLRQLLIQSNYPPLQLALLEQVDDVGTLNKVLKRTTDQPLKTAVEQKLADIQQQQTIPLEVEQQAKMLLSLLLALKDSSDYLQLQAKQAELSQSFQQLALLFGSLTQDKADTFQQKYTDIQSRLEAKLQELAPQWQAQQADAKLQQQWQQQQEQVVQALTPVETLLENAEATEAEIAEHSHHLEQVRQDLLANNKAISTDKTLAAEWEGLHNRLDAALAALKALPEFIRQCEQGQQWLDAFEQLQLPSELSQLQAAQAYLAEQSRDWRALRAGFAAQWPTAQQQQWTKIQTAWQQAIGELETQLKQRQRECRAKARAISGLLSQGRYKKAIAFYHKAHAVFEQIPAEFQISLQRSYHKLQQEIENLKDWQAYVALPKKPGLLSEAELLAQQPLDMEEQARQVKHLRSQWNSLGNSGTEADNALNQAFEVAIEQAFAPCREHFAKEEQARETHYQQKLALIEQAKHMGEQLESADLGKKLHQLQQKWRNTGRVDYRKLQQINEAFNQALAPLKAKVAQTEADNQQAKQALVDKVKALSVEEDLNQAIEQAKSLQQKWKQIGHAGRKAEDKLWAAFRQANDALFGKRQAVQDEHKAAEQALYAEQDTSVNAWLQQLEQADGKEAINALLKQALVLVDAVATLPEKRQRGLHKRIEQGKQQGQQKLQELQQAEQSAVYAELFSCLSAWTTSNHPNIDGLKKHWQQAFNQITSEPQQRHQLTVKLEILASRPVLQADAELKKQMQLDMLSEKLKVGQPLTKDQLLQDWIRQGPLSDEDQALLQRVKQCF